MEFELEDFESYVLYAKLALDPVLPRNGIRLNLVTDWVGNFKRYLAGVMLPNSVFQ